MEMKMKMEEVMKFVVKKSKEALLGVEYFGGEALAWFDKVFPPETRREKMKEALLAVKKFGGETLAWFDKVFPPETRWEKINQWFLVARPYLIAAVVVWFICRCCGGGRGGKGKMMKAPGRNYRMPRNAFESNPKAYFSNLRR